MGNKCTEWILNKTNQLTTRVRKPTKHKCWKLQKPFTGDR